MWVRFPPVALRKVMDGSFYNLSFFADSDEISVGFMETIPSGHPFVCESKRTVNMKGDYDYEFFLFKKASESI